MTGLPFGEPLAVPLAEQIACIEREIGMRERVYPRWVAEKRLTQAKADKEMAAMRAVLRTLTGLAAAWPKSLKGEAPR